ncbi:MAG: hypothetical protein SGPRY_005970 [Prymnesium sp.]
MLNCSDAGSFSFSDALVSTCVYDESYSPSRWVYLVSCIVVVLWFLIARFLYDGYYRLTSPQPSFTLAEHLTKRDNPALAIQFSSFCFSIGLITRGSLKDLPVENDQLGEYFYTFFAYQKQGKGCAFTTDGLQGLGLTFMVCVMLLTDFIILRGVHNFKAVIEKRNIGVACVDGGSLIASALVVAAAAEGQYIKYSSDAAGEVVETVDFGYGILAAFVFWAIGQALLVCYVKLLSWLYSLNVDIANASITEPVIILLGEQLSLCESHLSWQMTHETPEMEMTSQSNATASPAASTGRRPSVANQENNVYSMLSQIETTGNPAAGLSAGFDMVVAGVAISTPIRAGYSLMALFIWVPVVLVVVMPLMQVYLDIVILRGTNYRYNVLHSRNWSAAFLIGSLKLLCILLLDNMYPTNCATKQYVDRGECLPPKYGNDLGDRLVVSALPDFFEWQSLFGLLVLLLLLLVVKGFYQLRFARRLEGRKFDVDQVLANPNSSAMAVSFAGYCFGQGLVLVGVTTCADNDVGRHIGNLFGWTAIGCILMFLSQFVNDKLIIRRMDNTEEILKDNLAVGIMEAGLYIATGLVVRATMTGAGYSFAESLAITFTFWALSQVLITLFSLVYQLITEFNNLELIKSGNPAAGLGAAMTLVSLSLGMAYPIAQYGSIAIFVPVGISA